MTIIDFVDVHPGDTCLICHEGTYIQFAQDSFYAYLRCPQCQHERLLPKMDTPCPDCQCGGQCKCGGKG